jgi:hypothetical protein
MKCEYCQHDLKFSHHEKSKEIQVYDCTNCPVLVSKYYRKDQFLVKTTFMLDRNRQVYLWTNDYVNNVSYIVDGNVTLFQKGTNPMLLKFPKLMNLTPANVHEKFSYYVVFI